MKTKVRPERNGSGVAAISQTKTNQSRAAALPRKLPVDWAEQYIAKEFKVVALRECPIPKDLLVCDTPEKAAEYWRLNIATDPRFNSECECLVVLILNARRRVKGHYLVATGTLDTILAHPREVFRAAIVATAAAIVLMHNHPSGESTPSEADIKVTRDMIRAGRIVKIEVLDHVIVGQSTPHRPKDYTSLRVLGYFGEFDADASPPRKMSKREQVLAEFRALSQPDNLAAQLRQQDMPRRRLLYNIRRLAAEPYWRAIAQDKFGTADETRLDLVQLTQLRITLTARSRSRSRRQAAAA